MKVIVAIDNSPYSQYLIDTIGKERWPDDTQFKVLSVIETLDSYLDEELTSGELRDIAKRRHKQAEALAERVRYRLQESIPHSIVHYEIRYGDPRHEIVDSATEWEADRILVGTKVHQACPHNLPDSVSESVAKHAHCSVS